MNINANEIQFMNRKFMKLREETNPEQKMRADEPTTATNPDDTMKAMNQLGVNNMAFKGLNVAKLGNKAKSVGLATLLGLMTAGSVASLTSCEPSDIYVSQNVEVKLDIESIVGSINELNENVYKLYQAYLDGQAQIYDVLQAILVYEAQNAKDNAAVISLLKTNNALCQELVDGMVANGKSQAEANAFLQQILNSNLSTQEQLAQILDAIGQTNVLIASIKEDIKVYGDKIIEEFEKNAVNRKDIDAFKSYLSQILNAQFANNTIAASTNAKIQKLLELVTAGKIDFASAMNQIKDILASIDANVSEILNQVKANGDKLVEIAENMNMNTDSLRADMKAIYEEVAAGNLSQKQANAKIINLIMQSNFIASDSNNMLKKFYNEYKSGKTDEQKTLDKMTKLLEIISGKLDTIIKQMSDDAKVATQRFTIYQANFKQLIDKIGQGSASPADLSKIEEYMKALNGTVEQILEKMDELEPATGGMSFEQFKAYMDQRDPKFVAQLDAMLDAFGDELFKKIDNVADLQKALNGDFADFQDDCLDLLGKIFDSVKDIDLVKLKKNDPEKYDYLMNNILEPFKCHCCGCDCPDYSVQLEIIIQNLSKWNEGIIDKEDYDKLLG